MTLYFLPLSIEKNLSRNHLHPEFFCGALVFPDINKKDIRLSFKVLVEAVKNWRHFFARNAGSCAKVDDGGFAGGEGLFDNSIGCRWEFCSCSDRNQTGTR